MKDAFMRNKGIHRKIRSSLKSNKEALMRDKMNKRKAGKAAYKSGITLERKIEALAYHYQHDNPLQIELIRNHDALNKARGRGGRLTAYTSGISSCDFSFWVSSSFQWIVGGMIEAKNRQRNRINKSAISCHQKDQLIRLEKLGHCGFVLAGLLETVEGEDKQNYFLVPVSHWYKGKKKSHNSEDLRQVGYELNTIEVHNSNGDKVDCPDILEMLLKIDSDGEYKPLPKHYRHNFDNTKLHETRAQYSTIDKDLEDIEPDID